MQERPEELERTPQIIEYDRSRRRVIARVAAVVIGIGVVAFWFTRKAEEYFFSATGDIRSAYIWGFWTPVTAAALLSLLFLIVWYTPLLRAVRVNRREKRRANRSQTTLP